MAAADEDHQKIKEMAKGRRANPKGEGRSGHQSQSEAG